MFPKKNPIHEMMSGLGLAAKPPVDPAVMGSATTPKRKISTSGRVTVATQLPNAKHNAKRVIMESMLEEENKPFTEDDFLIIDFVNESDTKAYGDFHKKIQKRLACWELQYRIRTIPSVYFDGGEMEQEVIKNINEDYDEYELLYVHQSFCDHMELKILIRDIMMQFIDPRTHLIAAQAKIIPRNLNDHLKKYGSFKDPIAPGDSIEINYTYDETVDHNWSFADRPLTSMPAPKHHLDLFNEKRKS